MSGRPSNLHFSFDPPAGRLEIGRSRADRTHKPTIFGALMAVIDLVYLLFLIKQKQGFIRNYRNNSFDFKARNELLQNVFKMGHQQSVNR